MTPAELKRWLRTLVDESVRLSVMLWGPPGIGKSSVVAQVAADAGLRFVDVRLSQLTPSDLRGLPIPEGGVSRWAPPEFLPTDGRGVLFLDEINLAPPAMQGVAQQLILDRRVGSYVVPDGWFIWAAGNRKEDRGAVFDMPAPLANRFVHLDVSPDLKSFLDYSASRGLADDVVAFLSFRPALLHRLDPHHPAWPSPRSWEMASTLHGCGLGVDAAVGEATGAEFRAYLEVCKELPDLDAVLDGDGSQVRFPDEPSKRYAVTVSLASHADDIPRAMRAFSFMNEKAGAEWTQLFASQLIPRLRERGLLGEFATHAAVDSKIMKLIQELQTAMAS